MKKNTDALASCLAIVIVAIVIIPLILAGDWGLWRIYINVVVLKFHWPYLGYWEFVGLLILVMAVANYFRPSTKESKD